MADKINKGESDDTEGNALRSGRVDASEPEPDDAEGNGVRIKIVKDGIEPEGDDTEGNGVRVRF